MSKKLPNAVLILTFLFKNQEEPRLICDGHTIERMEPWNKFGKDNSAFFGDNNAEKINIVIKMGMIVIA